MSNEWDEYADGWDDDPVVRAYAEAADASLIAELAGRELVLDGSRVLDFGCGTGLLTESLAARCRSVDAVDPSPAMLDVVRSKIDRHGWTHVEPSLTLPAGRTYDLIVCSSVCSFLDDYPGTVAMLADLLAPAGLFVQWDWELDDTDDEPHGLSRVQVDAALAAAGLESITVRTAFAVPVEGVTMAPLMGIGAAPAS